MYGLFKCCKECKQRTQDCHGTCEYYLADKAMLDAIKQAGKAKKLYDQYYNDRRARAFMAETRDRKRGWA